MLDILVPDLRTVMMMQMLVLLLFAGIFTIVWRQGDGGGSPGLLPLGLMLGVIGNSLWVIGASAYPVLARLAANVLMDGGMLLFFKVVSLLTGRRFPFWLMPPVIAADALLSFHFTRNQPSFHAASVFASCLHGALYLWGGAMLLGERRPWRLVAVRCVGISVIGLGLIHATRIGVVLFGEGMAVENGEARRGGPLVLLFMILTIAALVSLLWVYMADSRNALQKEVESRRASEAALARAKEAAEQVAASRSRFLANMSHEIRTPMNAVSGLARLLGQTGLDARQRVHVTRITAAADLLLKLTDGVLSVARLEAGRASLDESDFDLVELLDGVTGVVSPEAEAKGLDFVVERRDGVPAALRGDAGRLGQILLNLVGNAVKFTDAGSVRLSVDPAGFRDGHWWVRFTVRDTGPGVDLRHLSEIFEPFHQPDAALARRHGGSGLGLAIARQAAALMGGAISADSLPGHGSAFTVILPFGIVDQPVVSPTTPVRLDGRRILVVDDDEVNREVAREILEQSGAAVATARDGREAVALAIDPAARIDAVLMDVRMPAFDGLMAATIIRQKRALDELPVIAVTAHAYDEDRRQCLIAGMNDFVTKPLVPERLLSVLDRWLKPRTTAASTAMLEEIAPVASSGPGGLPERIAGFDLAAALERFCGNEELVRHLLGRFAQRCAEAAALLAMPGDAAGMRLHLHRLQGAALTLGAERIAGHAAHLTRMLDDGETAVSMASEFAAMTDALSAAVAAIQAADIGAVSRDSAFGRERQQVPV